MSLNKIDSGQIKDVNTPNGIALLNSNGKIPMTLLGNSSPDVGKFLRGDGSWIDVSGSGTGSTSLGLNLYRTYTNIDKIITLDFTLTDANFLEIFINGILQTPTTYSTFNNTVTLNETASGSEVVVKYIEAVGPQGTQGMMGAQGNTGVPGTQGNQGAQGPQGHQGVTGAASTVQGPQGNTGPQGAQGPQGYQGASGSFIVTNLSVGSYNNFLGNIGPDGYSYLISGNIYPGNTHLYGNLYDYNSSTSTITNFDVLPPGSWQLKSSSQSIKFGFNCIILLWQRIA